jgi:hypothetical protein
MGEPHDHDPAADKSRSEVGFPPFEHNQWTVEGEIERFGAFGQGVARARGWKRLIGLFLVLLIVLPILLGAASVLARVLR